VLLRVVSLRFRQKQKATGHPLQPTVVVFQAAQKPHQIRVKWMSQYYPNLLVIFCPHVSWLKYLLVHHYFVFFAVPCKVTKRTSLSANAQKRRSFLPTPLRSDRITRSQSLRSRPGSSNTDNAPLPFNISPSAELAKPRRPAAQAPADHNLESLRANSRLSDPFSPASQMTTVDPDSTGPIGGDAVVRNLIEWSPALPKEVSGQNFSLGLIYMYLGGCFLRSSSNVDPKGYKFNG